MSTEGVRANGAIAVSKEGKRFMKERTTRDKASATNRARSGGTAFPLFDEGVGRSHGRVGS